MRRILWFCPENDIALGHGLARFTPPRRAALLARSGAPLMWWTGTPGDYVLLYAAMSEAETAALRRWENETTERFGAGPRFVTSLRGIEADALMPWGWSAYTASALRREGASEDLLQGIDTDAIRALSHRRTATAINRALAREVDFGRYGNPLPQGAEEFDAADAAAAFIAAQGGNAYIKSPWSSSGRGVVCCAGINADSIRRRCDQTTAAQGSVMVERAHDKVADFAMLFEARADGSVRFHGYSRFFNSHGSAYGGNLIDDDATLFASLCELVPGKLLHDVRNALEKILATLIGGRYTGYLGVDMLVARDAGRGTFYIVPCVELNLRMTMGVVAHSLARHHSLRGMRMAVLPAGAPLPPHADVVPLVPPGEGFNIVAL